MAMTKEEVEKVRENWAALKNESLTKADILSLCDTALAFAAQIEAMRGHVCDFACVDTEYLVTHRTDVERGDVARESMRELADFLDCGEEKVVRRVKEWFAQKSP